jgi:hypothetical protein
MGSETGSETGSEIGSTTTQRFCGKMYAMKGRFWRSIGSNISGPMPFVVVTIIVCYVNKKSAIDHHCRRSQVLGGDPLIDNGPCPGWQNCTGLWRHDNLCPCVRASPKFSVLEITHLPTPQRFLLHAKETQLLTCVPCRGLPLTVVRAFPSLQFTSLDCMF